jgi:hypothetical protein
MKARGVAVIALIVGALIGLSPGWASAERVNPASLAGKLQLQTVPPLAGVVVTVDGHTATSDAQGRISVAVRNFTNLEERIVAPPTQIAPDRKVVFDRFRGELSNGARGKVIEMGVRTSRLISWQFIDRFGAEVPVTRVLSMQLRSSTGETVDVSGPALTQPLWVNESRTQQGPLGLVSKPLYYLVDSAIVSSASVVNKSQQRFVPWDQQRWVVQLLFFRVSFNSSDLLFARDHGNGVELSGPDGVVRRLPYGDDGRASIPDLPRGTYTVKVYGGGVSFSQPVSISKDQVVSLNVISWLDLGLLGVVLLGVALGLIFIGRPRSRARLRKGGRRIMRSRWLRTGWLRTRWLRTRWLRRPGRAPKTEVAIGVILALLVTAVVLAPARPAAAAAAQPPGGAAARATLRAAPGTDPVSVLAYYYIWFNPSSWNRAKVDFPLLGRYSSDDAEIMRRHVKTAKAAGIGGFLVSWKHTPQLDERLTKLAEVAKEENFKLGIVYQGLDFSRTPLPLETVRTDLTLFADVYASNPVFTIFDKPLVVWTGSDQHTQAQIEETVGGIRSRLLVLGNAKSVKDIDEAGAAVDGHAYYWSSVDPTSNDTAKKLAAMATSVHKRGGIWIAPVAPGFDARLVGGEKEVPRRDGATLRQSFAAARGSEPDAIGLISWNEFSENTHIEPSQKYGATELNVLAGILGASTIDVPVDSSDTTVQHGGLTTWGALFIGAIAIGLLLGLAVIRRRRSRNRPPTPPIPLSGE